MISSPLLPSLERYYDSVPRAAARAEAFGPLTLFVRASEGWPYYARPTHGWAGAEVTAADVRRVRERQRELGVPESFEWVDETTPALRAAASAAGLTVHEHPLMALSPDTELPELPPAPVRLLTPDDPALPSALAAQHAAFGSDTTAGQLVADGTVARTAGRIAEGLTVAAAAVAPDGTALSLGQHNPVGDTTEIVGVGTAPAARRQGLGLAVTAALVAHARAHGVRTVFLSASDADVARLYARLGFRPVGTALIAEPPTDS